MKVLQASSIKQQILSTVKFMWAKPQEMIHDI